MTAAQKFAGERNLSKGKIASMIGLIRFLKSRPVLTRTEKAWLNDASKSLENIYENWEKSTPMAKRGQ